MSRKTEFQTFEEFWPFYLGEHSNPLSRKLHIAGTSIAVLAAAYGVLRGKPKWIVLAPLFGYGPAWVGHYIIEKNRPATFTHPLWSLRGDFKMASLAYTGKLGGELERLGISWPLEEGEPEQEAESIEIGS